LNENLSLNLNLNTEQEKERLRESTCEIVDAKQRRKLDKIMGNSANQLF
jgi:hypothetical protein